MSEIICHCFEVSREEIEKISYLNRSFITNALLIVTVFTSVRAM